MVTPLLAATAVGTLLNCGVKLTGVYATPAERFDAVVFIQGMLILFWILLTGLLDADSVRLRGPFRRSVHIVKTVLLSFPVLLASVYLIMIPCLLAGMFLNFLFGLPAQRPTVSALLLLVIAVGSGIGAWRSYSTGASNRGNETFDPEPGRSRGGVESS